MRDDTQQVRVRDLLFVGARLPELSAVSSRELPPKERTVRSAHVGVEVRKKSVIFLTSSNQEQGERSDDRDPQRRLGAPTYWIRYSSDVPKNPLVIPSSPDLFRQVGPHSCLH